MRTILFLMITVFATATMYAQTEKEGDALMGKWLSEGGKGEILIVKNAEKYYGKMVWLKEPNDKNGKPKLDTKNPDEKLKSKPIVGMWMLKDFNYSGKNVWEDGTIYDPESGKTYSCKVTLLANGNLEVRGYVGISAFGKTTVWTRKK